MSGLIQGIQAFPLNAGTFTGTASNFKCKNYKVLKMGDDGDITIKYLSGASKSFTGLKAGMDFSLPDGAIELTSTVAILLS